MIFVRKFSVDPRQPRLTLHTLVNLRWRTETGSSYKSVMGRYVNVMTTATTQFSGMPDPLPLLPISPDFGDRVET